MYYSTVGLNIVKIGNTKPYVMSLFPGKRAEGVPGMQIRAAKKSQEGQLLEVGEVLLSDGVSKVVAYWFLFENEILVQWGRPEDWYAAAGRYDIQFNPSRGVPRN